MRSVVVDASAWVEYLLRTDSSDAIGEVIQAADTDLHAPALCDVEVAAALRRALLPGRIAEERAREALRDYLDLSITRHGQQLLLDRILELRENFSAYDAAYVALAERIEAELLTADEALVRAVQTQLSIATLPA